MLLLIDNYDSFVYNLQRYFVRLGQEVVVVRNDDVQLADMLANIETSSTLAAPNWEAPPAAVVLSPGPCGPDEAGFCLELVQKLSGHLPILGVCLGHQVICQAFGGRIVRAQEPLHGRLSPLQLKASPLFAHLPLAESGQCVEFARYHSLIAETSSLPKQLRVTAWSTDEQIMAVEHRQHATYGVQFHPESILSREGYRVLNNFLGIAGLPVAKNLPCEGIPVKVMQHA